MGIRERLSGNEAVAYAMKQINPDVMGAYPITPSTEIPQYFSTYVDNGEVDTLFIAVESEHSAMSTCIGAEAAGCRAISATSSCGLCYMTEMLYVAASDRLPITLAVSCRALSGPININNDHSDAMGVRDAGWLMLFAETNQEAYDNYLQAMRIAEAVEPAHHGVPGRLHHLPRHREHRAGGDREGQGVRGRVQARSTALLKPGEPHGRGRLRHCPCTTWRPSGSRPRP